MWYALFFVYLEGQPQMWSTFPDFTEKTECVYYMSKEIDLWQHLIDDLKLNETVAYGVCFKGPKTLKISETSKELNE